ncbi:radical SAM family heme chaperone HemW [Haloferula sp. A504]|uniref:radical SAM family heme chaperone HemW n=1 Tax=Haloferula sp. A504 TaxID=3373601 RepID=UPI0031C47927|nr:radical SAM family heme chaperone HemW [Verrucomicrobiaceae bacterium E54]
MLVYLHIPFCHRICPYCSFYKHTPGATPIPRFIDAVVAEARERITTIRNERSATAPRTLYLGGGTPSMLSPAHLQRLFEGLSEVLSLDSLDEVTLEANPATFDLAKARLFRDLGVRRVSLGIQSFDPATLRTLGREHDPGQAAEAVRILREAGMPSVNIDLIFSVPGLSLDSWRATLETTLALEPDHVSAYNLTYEEDTEFLASLKRGHLDEDEDRDAVQFHLAHDLLTAAGFDHYETSNYARDRHHSTHNRGYWQGEDYLGLGPSAVSTIAALRTTNVADTDRYVRMIEAVGHATVESEALDAEQLRLERLALLLRTKEGVPLEWLDADDSQRLIEAGLARVAGDHFILTRQGAALVDPIAAELA